MAESHKVVEHQLPLVPKPSSSGVAMGDADGSGASGEAAAAAAVAAAAAGRARRSFVCSRGGFQRAARMGEQSEEDCRARKMADEPRVDRPQLQTRTSGAYPKRTCAWTLAC